MAKSAGVSVHLMGLTVTSFGLWYSIVHGKDQHGNDGLFTYRGWPGKFKYLTFWCQVVQFHYFAVAVLNDTLGSVFSNNQSKPHTSRLQRLRDNFHSSLAFPVAMFVVSTFWVLYAINRELVFPKELDKFVPVWQNHIIHTLPIVWLLLEKMTVHVVYPSRKSALPKIILFALIYQIWIIYIALETELWVYPVLRVMTWAQRVVFFMVLWIMLILFYLVGERLSALYYPGKEKTVKKLD